MGVKQWGYKAARKPTHLYTHTRQVGWWGAYPRLTAVREVREENAAATANAPSAPMSFDLYIYICIYIIVFNINYYYCTIRSLSPPSPSLLSCLSLRICRAGAVPSSVSQRAAGPGRPPYQRECGGFPIVDVTPTRIQQPQPT